MYATAVTASQSMPAGQLSVRTMAAVTIVARTPFRVHSTFRTFLSNLSNSMPKYIVGVRRLSMSVSQKARASSC